ncbi:hypothetical protein BCR36DRAFT_583737 [Piromyces finnis]|uniref:Phosphoglycerate mutase-like protein n=1 Tax=Piromyces finnis TaxID=1754191 RepID=A0A1Y1V8B2_9FUNG|nr:hypothetical protein BCR36DRAFT_583737 [Piromyces finnis]|eukprot:ORX49669.1 hypothetical protein BCR36DRAFT_583737 [Piromyces finnis]
MVIRHGEKINDDLTYLSPRGEARAYCLINVFGNNGTYAKPQLIYAQSPTEKKQSTRPRDTVVPLADALGLNVNLFYASGQIKKLVQDINKSTEDVVLISWSNDKIPEIAEKFGISNPPDWDNDTFDEIWMIYNSASPSYFNNNSITKRSTYYGNEGYTMEIVKQNVDDCIAENISKFKTSNSINNGNSSSDAFHIKNSLYMMALTILFSFFVIYY